MLKIHCLEKYLFHSIIYRFDSNLLKKMFMNKIILLVIFNSLDLNNFKCFAWIDADFF